MTPAEAALIARSVLSCPDTITLRVDDARQALDDEAHEVSCDVHGAPLFSTTDQSALMASTRSGLTGEVELTSGLGDLGSRERQLRLVMQGRLVQRDAGCECCGDPRSLVALDLATVTLLRDSLAIPVDLDHFRDPRHVLNQGYLQRTVQHANDVHEHDLRTAMAATFGLPLQTLLAASLLRVDPSGMDVSWLDEGGAHTRRLDFLRTVSSPQELGAALRAHLHAGIC